MDPGSCWAWKMSETIKSRLWIQGQQVNLPEGVLFIIVVHSLSPSVQCWSKKNPVASTHMSSVKIGWYKPAVLIVRHVAIP